MEALIRCWRAVEACDWVEAIRLEWEKHFGVDAAALRPYLRPTGDIDERYPCFHGLGGERCPRRVHQRNGGYESVCGTIPAWCAASRMKKTDLAVYALDAPAFLRPMVAGVCERELLEPVALPGMKGLLPVGILARRAGRVLVVLATREGAAQLGAVLHLRHRARADAVAVIVDDKRPDTCTEDGVVELSMGDPAEPRLWRALRLLWPESWAERAKRKEAIFEDVRLEIATTVEGHVVRLNGVELEDFRYSDIKLARLLVLAAARHGDLDVERGGWINKPTLQLTEKEKDLGELRRALVDTADKRVGLSEAERKALLQASASRPGAVRLALHPRNIRLDESLRGLRLLGDGPASPGPTRRGATGSTVLAQAQNRPSAKAMKMLAEARRLGAPLPANTAGMSLGRVSSRRVGDGTPAVNPRARPPR